MCLLSSFIYCHYFIYLLKASVDSEDIKAISGDTANVSSAASVSSSSSSAGISDGDHLQNKSFTFTGLYS